MTVGHSFDDRAATWDTDPQHRDRAVAVAGCIRASVPLDTSMRMLEYGAGTGLVTQALRPQVGPVTLADTSRGMRDVIQAKIDCGELTEARVWDVDLTVESAPDERFDLIITVLTLHHVDDTPTVLARFAQLLTPGGTLCIVDLDHEDGSFHGDGFTGHHGFERNALTSDLHDTGFDRVAISDCYQILRDDRRYPVFLAVATTTTGPADAASTP